ncbi:phosphoribosyl-dephospho-CoA transferase [Pseudomonas hunanensis]|uniref:Phosphoribosyl-dephospho-CoA transferase n=1 Tax=Pseudomonas hunanensis TaxID=1247546 RepID=A0ACC6JXM1_9PSED|nr:malonate decarboxylase holo-ACP synthase [Pseudomonas hunanensis]MDR6710921.1 phosphoribosyl-dephospho-CoA transferase [Pseudomonas hunanensis]
MSAPRPHDLLWGLPPTTLPTAAPAWVRQVLASAQPVVVRRAATAEGRVAIGVRGEQRQQRFAWDMPQALIARQVSPEALRWSGPGGLPALRALVAVSPVLEDTGLAWGPTGGVGYQLASGAQVVHAASDLDLLLRTPEPLDRVRARALLAQLDSAPAHIDVQLETPLGAVALREWAGSARRVLLKSALGARLVMDPWDAGEQAA